MSSLVTVCLNPSHPSHLSLFSLSYIPHIPHAPLTLPPHPPSLPSLPNQTRHPSPIQPIHPIYPYTTTPSSHPPPSLFSTSSPPPLSHSPPLFKINHTTPQFLKKPLLLQNPLAASNSHFYTYKSRFAALRKDERIQSARRVGYSYHWLFLENKKKIEEQEQE